MPLVNVTEEHFLNYWKYILELQQSPILLMRMEFIVKFSKPTNHNGSWIDCKISNISLNDFQQ